MERLEISVPNLNDSFSKVVLDGEEYLLRFTWNDTAERWSFGIYTAMREPIVQGLKIVPKFPLNLQYNDERLPNGIFGVYSRLDVIGRDDFSEGRAVFAYIQNDEASD
jgi:hypothetical protein